MAAPWRPPMTATTTRSVETCFAGLAARRVVAFVNARLAKGMARLNVAITSAVPRANNGSR